MFRAVFFISHQEMKTLYCQIILIKKMQTLILRYDSDNTLIKSILNSAILAGAKIVDPEKTGKKALSNT